MIDFLSNKKSEQIQPIPTRRRPPVLMRRFKQCESLVFVVLPECVPGFAAPPPSSGKCGRRVYGMSGRPFCRSNPKICGKSVDKILFQLYNEYKEGKTKRLCHNSSNEVALTVEGGGYFTFIVKTIRKIIDSIKTLNMYFCIAPPPFGVWNNRPSLTLFCLALSVLYTFRHSFASSF